MAKKLILLIFGVVQTLVLCAAPFTVVIDAGHGGKDAGAIGRKGLQEKDLNLDVSIRLASKIRTQFPEVNVLLTRSADEFIPLQKRADFVNKHNADLFICIHTNAAKNRDAHGTEVFILGTDRMEENLDVAMLENAVIKLESDYQTTYQGFDPNSVESYIMFELMQNRYMDRSLNFASMVQDQFTQSLHREDRGVRQAAFWVLLKSACPSVLVEMGFVSNLEEEQYLKSDQGKREIAEALFMAFSNYYKPSSKSIAKDTLPTPVVRAVEPMAPVEEPDTLVVKQMPVAEQQRVATNQTPVWKVQIFVSKTILTPSDPNFKGLTNCTYREVDGIYKYMAGNCTSKEEAVALKEQLKDKFPDCFIVKIAE